MRQSHPSVLSFGVRSDGWSTERLRARLRSFASVAFEPCVTEQDALFVGHEGLSRICTGMSRYSIGLMVSVVLDSA